MISARPALLRLALAALLGFGIVACAEKETPWTEAEFQENLGWITQAGKAHAIVDICVPQLEADKQARFRLIDSIREDRCARL